jgi:hypothetical protein
LEIAGSGASADARRDATEDACLAQAQDGAEKLVVPVPDVREPAAVARPLALLAGAVQEVLCTLGAAPSGEQSSSEAVCAVRSAYRPQEARLALRLALQAAQHLPQLLESLAAREASQELPAPVARL